MGDDEEKASNDKESWGSGATPFYSVVLTLRITKEKMQFAKVFEQNWTLEVFTNAKFLRRSSRPAYELDDLRGELFALQIYAKELTPVKITNSTGCLLVKILDSRVRRSIREHLLRWIGYGSAFNSSGPKPDIRRNGRRRRRGP